MAVLLKEGIQPAVAIPVQQRLGLQGALVPAAEHFGFTQLRNPEII